MAEILHTSLSFIIAIAVLIAVHEYGHYIVARKLGIKVEKFSIGFGPAMFSWRSRDGEVLYVIAAIPLGGYVKMLGENPDEQVEAAELGEAERARAFHLQPVWKRAAIAAAGPGFNFLFAIIAYMTVAWAGQSVLPPVVGYVAPASLSEQAGVMPGDRVITVNKHSVHSWQQLEEALKGVVGHDLALRLARDGRDMTIAMQVPTQEKDALLINVADDVLGFSPGLVVKVDEVVADSPAARAGLRPGDIIRQVNGIPVTHTSQFINEVKAHPDQGVPIVVSRQETLMQLEVVPKADAQSQGRIGVRLGAEAAQGTELYRMGALDGALYGFQRTWEMTLLTLGVFGKMVTSAISPDNLGGPIAIAQLAGKTADLGMVYFISFLALISVNLGVLNLLPIPILDGGLLIYLGLEKLRGGPLSPRFLEITQAMGLVLIVSLMVFAFYNDLTRLFRG